MVDPGLWSTVQDRGRPGYARFGVPAGGAFDLASLDLANALVGNAPDAAGIELTLVGGAYRAEIPLALALAGAAMAATIEGAGPIRRPPIPGAFAIGAGETLRIGGSKAGARAYLAVAGGFPTPIVLGSRSTESRLVAGLLLPASIGRTPTRRPRMLAGGPGPEIRVVDGPDAAPGLDATLLEAGPYRVTPAFDRMGLRLAGPPVDAEAEAARPSAPVAPGAVQIAGGRPIVLGVAGGTMGGYLHLAQVIAADLGRVGQLRAGDAVAFRRVAVAEARRIDREIRARLGPWLAGIRAVGGDRAGL